MEGLGLIITNFNTYRRWYDLTDSVLLRFGANLRNVVQRTELELFFGWSVDGRRSGRPELVGLMI